MLSQNPSEVYFAFLDVETTGLDPVSGDKICEIAVIKTIDGQVADEFVTIVNPGRNISERAISIHGITQVMVNRAPLFRDIAKDLLDFLNDTVIVAHNAKFDLEFLRSELKNLNQSLPENEVIDTLGIARRYYSFPSNSLGEIARYIGLPIDEEHRALADVTTTKDIFEYFLKDLERRGIRLKRLKDILKLQGKSVELQTTNELVLPTEIEQALRDKGKLEIKYLSAYEEETSVRVIEPFDISVSKANTYIHAYCHLRKQRCTFRLDRILGIKALA
ncbi:MAG: exonuclease domain-containing protein [Candidatus Dadabacteria bacterium]|nr:exonuclease domain-containing protein [Candidatus Dadabacteria bacterium]MCZ6685595.1 exonuclease domain-containing protein [Candidatus Dadabacteria bacterium]